MVWSTLIPAALGSLTGGGGGGGGLGSLLGGAPSVKVRQSTSVNNAALASISLTNLVGSKTPSANNAGVTLPSSLSQTNTTNQQPDPVYTGGVSPNPVSGVGFGPAYQAGDLSKEAADSSAPILAGFSPIAIVGVLVIAGGALWFLNQGEGDKK